jgi:hypothetical protein
MYRVSAVPPEYSVVVFFWSFFAITIATGELQHDGVIEEWPRKSHDCIFRRDNSSALITMRYAHFAKGQLHAASNSAADHIASVRQANSGK